MLLAFDSRLIRTNHFDPEMAMLADRHYSRRTPGARQFCYSGRKLVLRNAEGTVLFVWMFPDASLRMDKQTGYNCAIFRNESQRLSSEIILEAEMSAEQKWGPNRAWSSRRCYFARRAGRRRKRLLHKPGKARLWAP